MSWWLPVVLVAVTAQAWFVPTVIARLPEPAALPHPREASDPEDSGDPGETELVRVLAAEGPKELYADLARIRFLRPGSVVASVLLAVLVIARVGQHPVAWVVALLGPTLVLLSVVDWRTRLLPRIVVLPATGALLVLAVLDLATGTTWHSLVRALIAMLLARSFFWVLWWIRRAGMGFGDVRLAALVGLVLGRISWSAWFLGLWAGLLLFALFGIGLTVARRDLGTLKRHLPYGPFMILGLYLGVLLGGAVSIV